MSEWKEYKLVDVAEIFTGYPFPGGRYEANGKLRVVRGENVTIGKLRWDTVKHWNYDVAGLEKYLLRPDDIVIGMDGSRVGSNRALIRELDLPLIIAQRVACLRVKRGFNPKYIWYTIFTDTFRKYVEAINTGTSIPHISQKQIADFEIMCPGELEQKRIAGVLSSLDDKIDLLNRENTTLEALAETLFLHYFIENPDPTWKEGKLGDILSVKGGTTPSTNEPRFWNGNIAWTSPRDVTTLNGMYLFKTERTITEEGLAKISSGLLPAGTLLMSSRAPVGVLAFAEIPVAINQGYIAIIDDKGYPKEFIYLWLKENMEAVHSYSNGSTFMEINKTAFKSLDITIPDEETINVFTAQVKSFFEKIKSNQQQMQTLTTQRDTLLPRLMSGEVKVKGQ